MYPVVTEQNRGKIKMKELSIQEQTSVTGGVSLGVIGAVLGVASAVIGLIVAISASTLR